MASEDISTSPVILRKSTTSRKHRVHSHSQSMDKKLANDFPINKILIARNRSLPKSSKVLTKTEPIQFKRCHSQQREALTALPSKLERQSTNIHFQTRLPTFHTLTKDNDQKRISDSRRRQIYALNHLMRDLEQEQFRQFCKLRNIGTDNNEHTVNNNEDTNKEP